MTTQELAAHLRSDFGDDPLLAEVDPFTLNNATLLLHLFRQLIQGQMARRDWVKLERALLLADTVLQEAVGDLREMFYVSFQEHLLLRGSRRHRIRAIGLMPPATRDWYLKQWPNSL